MPPRNRRPSTPGEILKNLYLEPNGVSVARFARAVGVSRKHMSNVIHGRARVEPKLAIRIGTVLDTSPDLWLNIQRGVDVYDARRDLRGWKPAERLPLDGPEEIAAATS